MKTVLVIAFAATTSGCTLIGLGTGVAIDGFTPSVEAIPAWQAISLKLDTQVKVIRGNGQPIEGVFVGIDVLTNKERKDCFPPSVSTQGTVGCPTIGDSISIRKQTLAELEVGGVIERMTEDRIEILTKGGQRSIHRDDIIQLTDPQGLSWRGDQVKEYFLLNYAVVVHMPQIVRIPISEHEIH